MVQTNCKLVSSLLSGAGFIFFINFGGLQSILSDKIPVLEFGFHSYKSSFQKWHQTHWCWKKLLPFAFYTSKRANSCTKMKPCQEYLILGRPDVHQQRTPKTSLVTRHTMRPLKKIQQREWVAFCLIFSRRLQSLDSKSRPVPTSAAQN